MTVTSLAEHIDTRVTCATASFFDGAVGDIDILETITPITGSEPDVVYSAHCQGCGAFLIENVTRSEALDAAEGHRGTCR